MTTLNKLILSFLITDNLTLCLPLKEGLLDHAFPDLIQRNEQKCRNYIIELFATACLNLPKTSNLNLLQSQFSFISNEIEQLSGHSSSLFPFQIWTKKTTISQITSQSLGINDIIRHPPSRNLKCSIHVGNYHQVKYIRILKFKNQ